MEQDNKGVKTGILNKMFLEVHLTSQVHHISVIGKNIQLLKKHWKKEKILKVGDKRHVTNQNWLIIKIIKKSSS